MTLEEAIAEREERAQILIRMQQEIPNLRDRINYLSGYIDRAQEQPPSGAEEAEPKKDGEEDEHTQ